MDNLIDILKYADDAVGRDVDGDKTYRVHVSTAKQLIENAFEAGKKLAKEEASLEAFYAKG